MLSADIDLQAIVSLNFIRAAQIPVDVGQTHMVSEGEAIFTPVCEHSVRPVCRAPSPRCEKG